MKNDRFLNRKVLRTLLSRSDSTITRWVTNGKLPAPVDIGMEPYQPTYRWLASEVEKFLKIPVLTEEELIDRYLDTGDIKDKICVSHSTINRWRSQGHFPEPTSNTGTHNYWSRIAVDEWIVKIFERDRELY
jgi:predicted DNA-binding transcriptional regulator AlpA